MAYAQLRLFKLLLFEIGQKARKFSMTTMEMILKGDVFLKLHIIS